MRIPLPILGALTLALAAMYLVTVYTQAAAAVVNATALTAVGQNVTVVFNYVPHKINVLVTVGPLEEPLSYDVYVTIPGATFTVNGTLAHETYHLSIVPSGNFVLSIDVLKMAPGKPKVTVVVVRSS